MLYFKLPHWEFVSKNSLLHLKAAGVFDPMLDKLITFQNVVHEK